MTLRPAFAAVVLLTLAAARTAVAQATQATQATPTPPPASASEFAAALRAASPGTIARTTFADAKALPTPLPLTIAPSPDAAQLVFSDRPEYFRAGDGIASQDTAGPGRLRFYDYHVPVLADGKPRRVLTLVENPGDRAARITFVARAEPKAGGDYNAIAKQAMADLLNGVGGDAPAITIPPHGHVVWPADDATIAGPDLLVHAIVEFRTDVAVRITVAQVTAGGNADDDVAKIAALPKLPMLPYGNAKDKSGRGVFPNADVDVTLTAPYDTAAGPAQLLVADGKRDPWIAGRDGISGDATTDKGNYGVIYHVTLKWKSTDGRGVALLMTGNNYDPKQCGYVAAAVRVNDGRHPGGVVGLPVDATRFHGVPDACVIQTYDPPADGGEGTIQLAYTPPGACCLPTPILLVPIDR